MTVTINGTNGVTTPEVVLDNSAADGAQVVLKSSGYSDWNLDNYSGRLRAYYGATEYLTVNTSGNVGIGTSSPNAPLNVVGAQTTFDTNVFGQVLVRSTAAYNATPRAGIVFSVKYNSAGDYIAGGSSIQGYKQTANNGEFANGLLFTTQAEGSAPAERARIDSSGNLLYNCTGQTVDAPNTAGGRINETNGNEKVRVVTNGQVGFQFYSPSGGTGSPVGTITVNASSTSYNTSSDYRLKENIAPMTGALAKVVALKPCTYTWKNTGEADEGFIAHELQEVCPSAVTGEKDAVDAEGNPQYQGIDTSFLVATLTAAIQELKAINDAQAQTITALTARVTALENQP